MRLDPAKHPTPQAFWLEIDGQLLASHWQWGVGSRHQPGTGEGRVQTTRC